MSLTEPTPSIIPGASALSRLAVESPEQLQRFLESLHQPGAESLLGTMETMTMTIMCAIEE